MVYKSLFYVEYFYLTKLNQFANICEVVEELILNISFDILLRTTFNWNLLLIFHYEHTQHINIIIWQCYVIFGIGIKLLDFPGNLVIIS